GDALEDFFSRLRAGVNHVCVDRRKYRSAVLVDSKNPTRGAGANADRSSQLCDAAKTKSGGLLGHRRLGEDGQSAEREPGKTPLVEKSRGDLAPPEFVLFVNDPRLMTEAYRRYVEGRIRKAEPYPGLPIILTLRPRAQKDPRTPVVGTFAKSSK